MFHPIKRIYHNTIMDFQHKPLIYQSVKQLSNELKRCLIKIKTNQLDVKNAAQQLNAKLIDAMLTFNKGIKITSVKEQLTQFVETCHNAIYYHQSDLMTAPDLWNQIKAFINNFLEHYFKIAPLLETQKSDFALNTHLRKFFNNVKEIIHIESENQRPRC